MRSAMTWIFGPPQIGIQCWQLTIHIGLGHMIHIDERQITYGTPRQCLRCPGADTANADDADTGSLKSLHCLLTV